MNRGLDGVLGSKQHIQRNIRHILRPLCRDHTVHSPILFMCDLGRKESDDVREGSMETEPECVTKTNALQRRLFDLLVVCFNRILVGGDSHSTGCTDKPTVPRGSQVGCLQPVSEFTLTLQSPLLQHRLAKKIIALNAAKRPNCTNGVSRLNSNHCRGRSTHRHSVQRCKCMHANNIFVSGVSPGHVLDLNYDLFIFDQPRRLSSLRANISELIKSIN